MNEFLNGYSPPVSQGEIKYLHVLMSHCASLYHVDKDQIKERLRTVINLESNTFKDITFDQHQLALKTLKTAITKLQPNYFN